MRESFAAALAVATGSQEGNEPDPRGVLALRFYITSGTLAVVVTATAVAVIAGWWLDIPALKSVFPGFVTMKPNAALGLLLTGVALLLYRERTTSERRAKALKILLGTTVAIAVLTVVRASDRVQSRHRPTPGARCDARSWRAGAHVGLDARWDSCFSRGPSIWRHGQAATRWAQGLCGAAIFLATLNGVSYVFGFDQAARNAMAVHTAVCVLLVALGILFARPEQGLMDGVIDAGAGGLAIRSLLPIVFVLPLLLAWVSWLGVRLGWYGPSVAMALFVALTANALSYAVWVGAGVLRASDDQRQLAEAERARSEERLRRAVTDAPVPMVIHDADGRILHMSRGWSLYSGYTLAESPTMQAWIAATQPKGASPFESYLAHIGKAVETVQGGEWTITTFSREVRTWDFSTTPLGEPGSAERTLVTMAVDVTDRKLSETDLRRMNEDLEQRMAERTAELTKTSDSLRRQSDQVKEQTTLLDLVRDGILVRDLYGTIVYWSTGAAEMYGWTKEEAVGKMSHRLIRSELPMPLKEIEKHVTNAGYWEGEIIQTTKDGARLAVESRWTLTRTDRGRPQGFLEVNRDITRAKARPGVAPRQRAAVPLRRGDGDRGHHLGQRARSHPLLEPGRRTDVRPPRGRSHRAKAVSIALPERVIPCARRLVRGNRRHDVRDDRHTTRRLEFPHRALAVELVRQSRRALRHRNRPRHHHAQEHGAGARRKRRPSWRARTRSSSSSPTSRRTTCRSRCAWSRTTRSCSPAGTRTSSTRTPTSSSTSPWTAPSACRS